MIDSECAALRRRRCGEAGLEPELIPAPAPSGESNGMAFGRESRISCVIGQQLLPFVWPIPALFMQCPERMMEG